MRILPPNNSNRHIIPKPPTLRRRYTQQPPQAARIRTTKCIPNEMHTRVGVDERPTAALCFPVRAGAGVDFFVFTLDACGAYARELEAAAR